MKICTANQKNGIRKPSSSTRVDLHLNPSPAKSCLHLQVNEPSVFKHLAFLSQGLAERHDFISLQLLVNKRLPEHSLISSQTFFFSFMKYPSIQSHRKEPGVFWHTEFIGQSAFWVQSGFKFSFHTLKTGMDQFEPVSLTIEAFVDIDTSVADHMIAGFT